MKRGASPRARSHSPANNADRNASQSGPEIAPSLPGSEHTARVRAWSIAHRLRAIAVCNRPPTPIASPAHSSAAIAILRAEPRSVATAERTGQNGDLKRTRQRRRKRRSGKRSLRILK